MVVSVALTSGRTIRWRKRRFVVVDGTGFDAIIAGRLESATSHGSPLVKPGQTMQPAGALRLQPTLCPWMKRSGRLLSSDCQSLNRSSKWTRSSERVPMWRRSPGSSTGIQLQSTVGSTPMTTLSVSLCFCARGVVRSGRESSFPRSRRDYWTAVRILVKNTQIAESRRDWR